MIKFAVPAEGKYLENPHSYNGQPLGNCIILCYPSKSALLKRLWMT